MFEEKALSRNIWQQGFECCQRGLPAPGTSGSGIYLRGSNVGPGLQIINNEFAGGSIFHEAASPDAQDSPADPEGALTIQGVRIAHNSMGKVNAAPGLQLHCPDCVASLTLECAVLQALGTQAELSLTQTAAKAWHYDFCPLLVFPQIASVKVHVVAESGFPVAVARPPQGCNVVVETETAVTGTITVEVDSSEPSPSFV